MTRVSDVSIRLGRGAPADPLPDGGRAAQVVRVDRGWLTVLTATGEQRVRVGRALHDGSGAAVGDWVALRGELAVRVLPRRTAFVRTGPGRGSAP